MARYEISNTESGLVLGIYEGETAEGAIRAMHVDAGYKDGAAPESIEGGENIVAREVESAAQFATIQVETQTVYGVGVSAHFAEVDAAEHGMECACDSRDGDCNHSWGQLLPGFETVPCTDAAAAYVETHGGGPSPALSISRSGVCLRSEEK